ncbi:S-methyl thiohydantoin desulfurase domain-containing protein [Caenimonas soli]|uniref:S-methyl thiohydantoin desulfurase domain-containing protein n=1 Tax=Caenimonas soli TaxID=2735555 RepID=UPI001554D98F|nr:DUF917 family protein [Caenimonas soli]NPC58524.1 DUF917 family protein [Caenimonas soli]
MERHLTQEDVWPAVLGGVLLSAGGSGQERALIERKFGEVALANGPLRLAPIASLHGDDTILVATGVGAPGQGVHKPNADHSIQAARQLLHTSGVTPSGVIPGHVPGIYGWVMAASLGIPVIDAACNGRGHPTVKMGSLGLASRPDVTFYQSGVGDKVRILVHGNTLTTSSLMRAAAVQNGGLIMACRGPFAASLVSAAGAVGAISYQLALGREMVAASQSGERVVDAVVRQTRGRILADGVVTSNTVAYADGFDVGQVTVRGTDGNEVALGVCNEYMYATSNGERVATFPDLIATLDPQTGAVLAIRELKEGTRVAIIATSKRNLPLGSGIFDPAIYPDVEKALGANLAKFALDPQA